MIQAINPTRYFGPLAAVRDLNLTIDGAAGARFLQDLQALLLVPDPVRRK